MHDFAVARTDAAREKSRVALSSVLAAVLLAGLKIAVGLATGSLGILAEALHSSLDFAAAAMTYAAVRWAEQPADDEHPYGHGKVESFSALFETVLLVVTCGWIIYEAVERLFFREVTVTPSLAAFGVMFISIIVDVSRSRALLRVAKKHKSQALEADALHFSTDIWSSAVVILGLTLVSFGQLFGGRAPWARADALAALAVAGIVLWVSARLGKATIDALLDRAPTGLAPNIAALASHVPGVLACRRVRVRPVGPAVFVDMLVDVAHSAPFEQVNGIVSEVERRVQAQYPQADVVVRVYPVEVPTEGWDARIQAIAGRLGLTVHGVQVSQNPGHRLITFHLEVSPDLSLADAHAVADGLERLVKGELDGQNDIVTHIEPQTPQCLSHELAADTEPRVLAVLHRVVSEVPALRGFHAISVRQVGERLAVTMHCVFDAQLPIGEVHRLATMIETRLKAALPEIADVHTHVEPPDLNDDVPAPRPGAPHAT
jgi:cation diffusion facilitator family transporter